MRDRLWICVLDIAVLIRGKRDLPRRILSCHDKAVRGILLHFTIIVGNSMILRLIFQILGDFVDYNRLSIFTWHFVANIVCHSFREKTCCLDVQIDDFTIDLAIWDWVRYLIIVTLCRSICIRDGMIWQLLLYLARLMVILIVAFKSGLQAQLRNDLSRRLESFLASGAYRPIFLDFLLEGAFNLPYLLVGVLGGCRRWCDEMVFATVRDGVNLPYSRICCFQPST